MDGWPSLNLVIPPHPLHMVSPRRVTDSQVKIQTKHGYVHIYGSKISESTSTAEIHKMRKRELTVRLWLFCWAVTVLSRFPARRGREVGRSESKQT